jgi:hypothetical protein
VKYEEMKILIPPPISEAKEMDTIIKVEGNQFDLLMASIDDILNNTFPVEATWGLDILEKTYGIKSRIEDSLEDRRARLLTKIAFKSPTTRKNFSRALWGFAESVYVEEIISRKLVEIFFENPKIDDLEIVFEIIESTLPAHLKWDAILVYPETVALSNNYQRWLYPFEYYAGNLIAGEEQVSNDNRLYASNFELDDSYSKAMNAFPICGDFPDPFPNEFRTYPSNFELRGVYSTVLQPYPICGTFSAGEVI